MLAVSTAKDMFKTVCKIATVAQRPFLGGLDQIPPEIDLFWARPVEAVFDPSEELVMVESRNGFFEAVRYVLVGLQLAAETHTRLDPRIVYGDRSDNIPQAQMVEEIDLTTMVHHVPAETSLSNHNEAAEVARVQELLKACNILHGLPDVSKVSTLDKSQLNALHRIVTKELAIIQGPPGTGKTFTSIEALRVMLANRGSADPPIIIAAQTNHVLDQLLRLCFEKGHANILRMGGRSEDDYISKRTMYCLRQLAGSARPNSKVKALENKRQHNTAEIQRLLRDIFASDKLLEPQVLEEMGVITAAQAQSLLVKDEWDGSADSNNPDMGPLADWLGDQVIYAPHIEFPLDNYVEDEEGDDPGLTSEFDPDIDRLMDDDEEHARLRGTFIPLGHTWTGREPRDVNWRASAAAALKSSNLWTIEKRLRGGVYRIMQERLLGALTPRLAKLLEEAVQSSKDLKANRWCKDVQVTRELRLDVVGCTTTGLTKYRGFLAALEPRVMLIEEAAQTREANIASALFPSLQQLILVGDHMQLTPMCDIRDLGGPPYNLNVSMFERLINLEMPYTMLNQQRRMKPELRAVLSQFYDGLYDHPEVQNPQNRPAVPGMGGKDSWLFSHGWPEDSDADNSRMNVQEAEMIVKFVAYLVQNGTPLTSITVLTFYNGQRKRLLRLLRQDRGIAAVGDEGFNVYTVDSYQGEENEIVILSLVRSPKAGNPYSAGFLDDQNRAVVAISRARRGFYIFGNMSNMLGASDLSFNLWGKIWNAFVTAQRTSPKLGLPVICQQHGTQTQIKNIDQWVGNAGGCFVPCKEKLPCGHFCKLNCHPMPHNQVSCMEPCPRMLHCGHSCANLCVDKCFCPCDHFQPLQTAIPSLPVQLASAAPALASRDLARLKPHQKRGDGLPQRGQRSSVASQSSGSPQDSTLNHSSPTRTPRTMVKTASQWNNFTANPRIADKKLQQELDAADQTAEAKRLTARDMSIVDKFLPRTTSAGVKVSKEVREIAVPGEAYVAAAAARIISSKISPTRQQVSRPTKYMAQPGVHAPSVCVPLSYTADDEDTYDFESEVLGLRNQRGKRTPRGVPTPPSIAASGTMDTGRTGDLLGLNLLDLGDAQPVEGGAPKPQEQDHEELLIEF
jgi:helicase required for RNAi-mediated heterochromatin assembly 1